MTTLMFEKDDKREEGLLQYKDCPDCKKPLLGLKRVFDFGIGHMKSKICTNTLCWRYTDLTRIDTWIPISTAAVPVRDILEERAKRQPPLTRVIRF